ncbi:MAG: hypothetical protein IJR49_04710, partial [Treponema sp.]|nr:hypothetical protein [Treponema sp.]
YFVELGHTMSSTLYKNFDHTSDNKINQELNEKKRNELIATFALATKSLGLSCGAAKADIKYTSKGPMIGEIAARLSGGYMSGWTYPYASGCNLTEEALLLSLGKSPKYLEENRIPLDFIAPESLASAKEPFKLYELPCKRWSVERAWISIPGKVSKIIGLESALSNEFIKDVFVRSKEGDSVTFPKNNVEKCGNIISCADKREDAIFAAENAISEIVVRLEPSCKETDNFLQEDLDTLFPPSAFLCSSYNHILREDERPTIPENESVVKYIPDSLKALFESEKKDWSYRTFKKTCILFDKIEKVHPVLDAKKFWLAALRAGLQGMLYVCDSSARVVVGE